MDKKCDAKSQYCDNCSNRIQPGKAYIKKNKKSAWYIVIKMDEENVFYKKMKIMNINYEDDVDEHSTFLMSIIEFKELFKFISTLYCDYEIYLIK